MADENGEVRAGELLLALGFSLAVAESCTGGLVCSRLTDVPGSSAYLIGCVVSYADQAKRWLLNVEPELLLSAGAVSEPVALQMAQGVRRLLRADVGLAVTGIAGPGGGSAEKPVGLVHLAVSGPVGDWHERHLWLGDRRSNKRQSADAALDLLCRYLSAGFP
jgi:PncC family amidohydrolase